MYGLVNRAIEELVLEVADEPTWERIRRQAKIREPHFISMHSYPDEMTYALVAASSEILEMAPEEILHAFGKHWILFTGKEGYGPLLEMAGSSLKEFLANLDSLHARLGMSMPDLRPPSFRLQEDPDHQNLSLLYFSDREGLAPMVMGLLEGLGERFAVDLKVEHRSHADHEEFRIELPDDGSL